MSGAHYFTEDDRRSQLSALADACVSASQLLREHGEVWHADAIENRATEALRLLDDGYTRGELNAVASQFPSGPDWLDPRQVDYNGPREPWQETVAESLILAQKTAQDLRAVATFLT